MYGFFLLLFSILQEVVVWVIVLPGIAEANFRATDLG
jgi:hypothetical protein